MILPPTLLAGEPPLFPLHHLPHHIRLHALPRQRRPTARQSTLEASQAGLVPEDVAQLDGGLVPVVAEFRPDVGHEGVVGDEAAVDQAGDGDGGKGFGRAADLIISRNWTCAIRRDLEPIYT